MSEHVALWFEWSWLWCLGLAGLFVLFRKIQSLIPLTMFALVASHRRTN
jgi:hypothetical protein